jgi:hypothetical protein
MKLRCPESDGHVFFITHLSVVQLAKIDKFGTVHDVVSTIKKAQVDPDGKIVCATCLARAVVEKGPGE